jgi:aconitase B
LVRDRSNSGVRTRSRRCAHAAVLTPLCSRRCVRPSARAASAELATVAAVTGKLPDPAEYLETWKKIDATASDTYRYLNFDTIKNYTDSAQTITLSPEVVEAAKAASA